MSMLGSLLKLPGNILHDVADILPNDKSHSDFDAYCKAKGGTVEVGEDGKKTCKMNISVGESDHAEMINGPNSGTSFADSYSKATSDAPGESGD